jgi:hypothetical protein
LLICPERVEEMANYTCQCRGEKLGPSYSSRDVEEPSLEFGYSANSAVIYLVETSSTVPASARSKARVEYCWLHLRLSRVAAWWLRHGTLEGTQISGVAQHSVLSWLERGIGGHRGLVNATIGIHSWTDGGRGIRNLVREGTWNRPFGRCSKAP